MLIPNAVSAIVDIRKLQSYVLDPTHGRGRHKARVFYAVFGLTFDDAEWLKEYLLNIALTHDVQVGEVSEFGQLYRIDSQMSFNGVTETVRSTWIIRQEEDYPRLVSCFVTPGRNK